MRVTASLYKIAKTDIQMRRISVVSNRQLEVFRLRNMPYAFRSLIKVIMMIDMIGNSKQSNEDWVVYVFRRREQTWQFFARLLNKLDPIECPPREFNHDARF